MMSERKIFDFSDKSHSVDGRIATFLGVIDICLFIYLAVMSIMTKGSLNYVYGIIGIGAWLISICGIVIAGKSFSDEETLVFYKKLGLWLNIFMFVLVTAMFMGGLFIIYM